MIGRRKSNFSDAANAPTDAAEAFDCCVSHYYGRGMWTNNYLNCLWRLTPGAPGCVRGRGNAILLYGVGQTWDRTLDTAAWLRFSGSFRAVRYALGRIARIRSIDAAYFYWREWHGPLCPDQSSASAVRLSVPSIDSSSGGFAAERRANRRYRSTAAGAGAQEQRRRSTALSSECGQCHVDSRGMRLNAHLLVKQKIKAILNLLKRRRAVDCCVRLERLTTIITDVECSWAYCVFCSVGCWLLILTW